jgi:hypothetical protein
MEYPLGNRLFLGKSELKLKFKFKFKNKAQIQNETYQLRSKSRF